MLGRVARLHYIHGLTHQQIADTLGLSRVKVTRLLAEARRTGVVEIRIHSDESIFTDLEFQLRERSNLEQVWVAPRFDDREQLLDSIATTGAACLQAIVHDGLSVAVGLSETVGRIAPKLTIDEDVSVLFVPAAGSRPTSGAVSNPHEVAHALATAFGGEGRHLPAPIVAASADSARILRNEPDVTEALKLARNAELGIFGIGGTEPGAGMLMDGTVPREVVRELIDQGAVGDISAAFYDANGRAVHTDFDQRVVGMSLEEIVQIPARVGIAGGAGKVPAILGAVRAGLITTLVTDERTAREVLERL